jgi:medium-chain acyl-[acyl-carrier-protein] hydrolase
MAHTLKQKVELDAEAAGKPGGAFDWLTTLGRREAPVLRLFCFPHAGGGSHAYAKWPEGLSTSVEVVGIEPPGRGNRLHEAPLTELGAMVAAVATAVRLQSDLPFAFFGHSLGAVVAYEVAPGFGRLVALHYCSPTL